MARPLHQQLQGGLGLRHAGLLGAQAAQGLQGVLLAQTSLGQPALGVERRVECELRDALELPAIKAAVEHLDAVDRTLELRLAPRRGLALQEAIGQAFIGLGELVLKVGQLRRVKAAHHLGHHGQGLINRGIGARVEVAEPAAGLLGGDGADHLLARTGQQGGVLR